MKFDEPRATKCADNGGPYCRDKIRPLVLTGGLVRGLAIQGPYNLMYLQSASIALLLGFREFFPQGGISVYIWPDARPKFGHAQLLKSGVRSGPSIPLRPSIGPAIFGMSSKPL